MSTRGFVGYRTEKGGEIFGHYNHSDSYPTGLGAELVDALKPFSFSAEYVKKYFSEKYLTLRGVASEKYYQEHRSFVLSFANGIKTMVQDGGEFYKDGLFCEWSYIFNLAEGTLSIYKGFATKPTKGIEDWNYENKHYVCFVGEFKLDELNEKLMEAIEKFYYNRDDKNEALYEKRCDEGKPFRK